MNQEYLFKHRHGILGTSTRSRKWKNVFLSSSALGSGKAVVSLARETIVRRFVQRFISLFRAHVSPTHNISLTGSQQRVSRFCDFKLSMRSRETLCSYVKQYALSFFMVATAPSLSAFVHRGGGGKCAPHHHNKVYNHNKVYQWLQWPPVLWVKRHKYNERREGLYSVKWRGGGAVWRACGRRRARVNKAASLQPV